jgi:hypothetical protein
MSLPACHVVTFKPVVATLSLFPGSIFRFLPTLMQKKCRQKMTRSILTICQIVGIRPK